MKTVNTFILFIIIFNLFLPLNTYSQINMDIDSLNQRLVETFKLDQEVRYKLAEALEKNGVNAESTLQVIQEMLKQDSINQSLAFPVIEHVLENDGDIPLSGEAYKACYYVLQHSSGEEQLKYAKFINVIFQNELISSREYAMFIDRLNVSQRKAQLYGTQVQQFQTEDFMLYPLKHGVDSALLSIGLDPVMDELKLIYKAEYSPIELNEDDFVCYGHIVSDMAFSKGIEDIEIHFNGELRCITNRNGFYSFVTQRSELPGALTFSYSKTEYEYIVEDKEDFFTGNYLVEIE